jgi:hypothetical protein
MCFRLAKEGSSDATPALPTSGTEHSVHEAEAQHSQD